MELFNQKYVHFMWDDELEGKEVFTADDIESLIKAVNNNNSRHQVSHTVNSSNLGKEAIYDLKIPFRNKDTCTVHQFAYYDPNYEVKRAYAEGEQIQYKYLGQEEWHDVQNENDFNILISLNDSDSPIKPSLRIKPEEPKTRPFEDFNELMSITGTKHLWVVDKCSFNEFLITGTQKHAVYIVDRWYSMKELFELYTFSDGSPCGINEYGGQGE